MPRIDEPSGHPKDGNDEIATAGDPRRSWGLPQVRVSKPVAIITAATVLAGAAGAAWWLSGRDAADDTLIYTFVSPTRTASTDQQTDGTSWFKVDDSWRFEWAVTARDSECTVDVYVVDAKSNGARRLDEFHGRSQGEASYAVAGTYSVSIVHECDGTTPSTVEIRVYE